MAEKEVKRARRVVVAVEYLPWVFRASVLASRKGKSPSEMTKEYALSEKPCENIPIDEVKRTLEPQYVSVLRDLEKDVKQSLMEKVVKAGQNDKPSLSPNVGGELSTRYGPVIEILETDPLGMVGVHQGTIIEIALKC